MSKVTIAIFSWLTLILLGDLIVGPYLFFTGIGESWPRVIMGLHLIGNLVLVLAALKELRRMRELANERPNGRN